MLDVKEKYRVSEIAEFFNISTDTVRLYDTEGLLSPSNRGPSKYRYYDWSEFLSFELLMQLKQMNFSLQEIKQIVNECDILDAAAILRGQEDRLEHQLEELQRARRMTKVYRNKLEEIAEKAGTFEFVQSPVMICREIDKLSYDIKGDLLKLAPFQIPHFTFIMTKEDFLKSCNATNEEFQQDVITKCGHYLTIFDDENLARSTYVSENEKMLVLPQTTCLHTFRKVVHGEEWMEFGALFRQIDENGYEPDGSVKTIMPAYFDFSGSIYTYYEYWVPVKKK